MTPTTPAQLNASQQREGDTDALVVLVTAAIGGLKHLSPPTPRLVGLPQRLRTALRSSGAWSTDPIGAAVEAACAQLDIGDLDSAYLALLTARDLITRARRSST